VTFHNGKDLTADDVIYSLKRHLDKATGSKVAAIAVQMTSFKAVDKNTIEIALASPNADLPTILSMHHFMIVADGTTDFSSGNVKDFVEGMKYLVNREQIVKSALRGFGVVGNDQPVSPANLYHNAALKPKAFDPEKAKFHFQKAGVLGQPIEVITSDAANSAI